MVRNESADRILVTLSGGQKQRAMVATVLSTEAPLLFLDEPTIGLDPFARRAVWDVLRDLTRKGCTVLLTTHYLDEAEALSERLYIVEEGRILFEGTADRAKRQIGGTLRVSIENGGEPHGEVAVSRPRGAGRGFFAILTEARGGPQKKGVAA